MREHHPKSWFRALFNMGLIRYVNHQRRMLPCEAGTMNFFLDPYGEVFPCNGLEEKFWQESMGNMRNGGSFEDIWFSKKAEEVRAKVKTCPKNCWMVGTASPVMHKYKTRILPWILRNKIKSLIHMPIDVNVPYFDVGQDPRQGNLRKDAE
jgi:radical SAM protein with 4Fe4S-binding SPASM domain